MVTSPEIKATSTVLRLASVFLNAKGMKASGADVIKATGLSSGTTYPLLSRMETAGWLKSEWEDVDASEVGRPRRRYYVLTGLGQRASRNAFESMGFAPRAVRI